MTDRTPSLASLEHTREELVRAQWTDWRAFLQANLHLLDARQAADRPANPFESDPHGPDAIAAAARAQLAALEPQRRVVFEQVYEQARQTAQAAAEQTRLATPAAERSKPLDPDTIDREVVQALLDDAEGRGPRAPRGRVPIEPGTWWVVDAATFVDAPRLDAYTITSSRGRGSRFGAYTGVAAMVGLGLIALLAYGFWPRPTSVGSRGGQPVVAAGEAVMPWSLRALQLAGTTVPSTTLLLDPDHTTGCTGLAEDGPAGGIEAGSVLPLRLCVRGVDLASVTGVTLFAAGDQPTRRYARTSAPAPDLALSAPDGMPWFGALVATEPMVDRAVGEAAPFAAATALRVAAITVAGPAEDPTVPDDQIRVTVAVSATAPVDWATLAPTLLSARGDKGETSATVLFPDGAQLSYVLPMLTEPLAVVWRVSRADGSVLRWRATLDPPPDRTALLQHALTLVDCRALVSPDDPTAVQLTLMVRNDGRVPLTLRAAPVC